MKRTIWGFLLFFTFVTVCFAQQNNPNTDEKNGGKVILKAGMQVSAQLQNTLDVETAKGNDDLVLKLTEDISSGDFTISKGSELLGGVVSAKKADDDEDSSEIIIYFDFLKKGDDYLSFKAIVVSISATGNTSGLQFVPSPFFKGATIISAKGKILRIEEGQIFQLKLDKDLMKP